MAGDWVASLLSVGLLGTALSAGQPMRADLVVTDVSVVQTGGALRITDVVANRGHRSAPPTTASYALGQIRIGRRSVPRLRPGQRSRRSQTLMIPHSLAPGSYRLRVCADATRQLREANEGNNCRAASQRINVTDHTPPGFAGLVGATTCIPGPAGGPTRFSYYALRWQPAVDDLTPASEIVYDIYQGTVSGAEDLTAPTYTSSAGATSFRTPLLPDDAAYYFIVRARDRAGNRDGNRLERLGMNLCV